MFTSTDTARATRGNYFFSIGKDYTQRAETFFLNVKANHSDSNSPRYEAIVEQIRKNLDLTTLKFQKLTDLVEAIGLPKEKLCTHCWDGSSRY